MYILRILVGVLLIFLFLITIPFIFLAQIFEKVLELYVILISKWLKVMDLLLQFALYSGAMKRLSDENRAREIK